MILRTEVRTVVTRERGVVRILSRFLARLGRYRLRVHCEWPRWKEKAGLTTAADRGIARFDGPRAAERQVDTIERLGR